MCCALLFSYFFLCNETLDFFRANILFEVRFFEITFKTLALILLVILLNDEENKNRFDCAKSLRHSEKVNTPRGTRARRNDGWMWSNAQIEMVSITEDFVVRHYFT